MSTDIARAIGAVTRTVEEREHDGHHVRVLVATHSYSTNRADLWDALTNPERIPRWFAPVTGDLQLGGKYQIEGNAGGDITACDPPTHLALDWDMHGAESWVTVTLSDGSDGGTVLRLEHLVAYDDPTWERYGPGATGAGWDPALFALQEHFTAKPALTPDTEMEWYTTDAGRSFVIQSSAAWEQADIASGTEPAKARAAAKRTRAFYTGEDAPDEDNENDNEGVQSGAD